MDRHRFLLIGALLALAAVALPGATSAAFAPVPPPPSEGTGHPLPVTLGDTAAGEVIAAARTPLEVPLTGLEALPPGAMVVSFYGYPGYPVMGRLGDYDPDGAARAVTAVAAEYDALNGVARAVPALHLIVGVAHPTPQQDGSYLSRLEPAVIESYVEAARRHGILLFLDVQVGWADPVAEVRQLERYLEEPFVHLALDPEFATGGSRAVPGTIIGTMGADDLNRVQRQLARLVRRHDLSPKLLVVHQFLDAMVTETEDFERHPEVEVTIDMDGFGGAQAKLSKYDRYSLGSYSERPALKLFYDWDVPLLTPADVMALARPPGLVIYQ